MGIKKMLAAAFEVNRQQIDAILEYRKGGGLDRVVETSARLDVLGREQLRLLELLMKADAHESREDV